MARNKYPEETRKLIIEVSTKLFFEKGYDQTSLQDIIDGLGGMTKGAIYHHFRSKEEILMAVLKDMSAENDIAMAQIRDDVSLTGKQKIEKIFSNAIMSPKQKNVFVVTPNLIENPKLLAYYLKLVAYEAVPNYIMPIIRQGVEDGSIQTDYPDELASLIMCMIDMWANPIIFQMSAVQLTNRILLMNSMLKPLGLELISEEMLAMMNESMKVFDE